MKKTGLTLGKYAPFHKGHQFVFDTALSEVDELVVLIYDTDVIETPLHIRAGWIRNLYPQAEVIECWDGPDGYSNERWFEIIQEEYIIKMLNGRKITHFYSSEFYGDHVSKALNAVDRRVDEARTVVPVSATKIRENCFAYKDYVSSIVYKDLITKAVFLGAMSSGKSTLTEALAKKFNTAFAPEYGREYWTEHHVDRRIGFEDFDVIAKRHIEIEDREIANANQYFFVDTNAITTYMFALDYHGKAPDFLRKTADLNYKRYDLFFLCDIDIPYDDTWDRSGDQKREIFQKQIIADLKGRNIPYILLSGNLEERIRKVENVLSEFRKYSNYFGSGI